MKSKPTILANKRIDPQTDAMLLYAAREIARLELHTIRLEAAIELCLGLIDNERAKTVISRIAG